MFGQLGIDQRGKIRSDIEIKIERAIEILKIFEPVKGQKS